MSKKLTLEGVNTVTKRIEYVDAMRGFTMILVVLSHVASLDMGLYGAPYITSYHAFFGEFRMPLFFFVSGFVLFKSGYNWNLTNSILFLRKKFSVQIISPFIFLLASIATRELTLSDSLIDPQKSGYWFTFTLFEYYLLYIIVQSFTDVCHLKHYIKDITILLLALGFYIALNSAT